MIFPSAAVSSIMLAEAAVATQRIQPDHEKKQALDEAKPTLFQRLGPTSSRAEQPVATTDNLKKGTAWAATAPKDASTDHVSLLSATDRVGNSKRDSTSFHRLNRASFRANGSPKMSGITKHASKAVVNPRKPSTRKITNQRGDANSFGSRETTKCDPNSDVGVLQCGEGMVCMSVTSLLSSLNTDANVEGIYAADANVEGYCVHDHHSPRSLETARSLQGYCPPSNRCYNSSDSRCYNASTSTLQNPFRICCYEAFSCTSYGSTAVGYLTVDSFQDSDVIQCVKENSCNSLVAPNPSINRDPGTGSIFCQSGKSCNLAFTRLGDGGVLNCQVADSCQYTTNRIFYGGVVNCQAESSCSLLGDSEYNRNSVLDGGTLNCEAALSCSGTENFIRAGGNVNCNVAEACAGARHFIYESAILKCPVHRACVSSTVFFKEEEGTLFCEACESCDATLDLYLFDGSGTLVCDKEKSCNGVYLDCSDVRNKLVVVCNESDSCYQLQTSTGEQCTNECRFCLKEGSCSDKDTVVGPSDPSKCQPEDFLTMCKALTDMLGFSLTERRELQFIDSSDGTYYNPCVDRIPPTEEPSSFPSGSFSPSSTPSESEEPSLLPSYTPSESGAPSSVPSGDPSNAPSASAAPSEQCPTACTCSMPPRMGKKGMQDGSEPEDSLFGKKARRATEEAFGDVDLMQEAFFSATDVSTGENVIFVPAVDSGLQAADQSALSTSNRLFLGLFALSLCANVFLLCLLVKSRKKDRTRKEQPVAEVEEGWNSSVIS